VALLVDRWSSSFGEGVDDAVGDGGGIFLFSRVMFVSFGLSKLSIR
jgi:hypothetical protein